MPLGTLDDALHMARQGVRVFPIRVTPSAKEPGKWDKVPLTEHGHLDGTCDEEKIRAWGASAWGAVAEKFVAMDVDSLEAWTEYQRRGAVVTPTLPTMRESCRHLYFRPFPGARSTTGVIPGVDSRGGGTGWVVLYGRWNLSEMAEAPAWFQEGQKVAGQSGQCPTFSTTPDGKVAHDEHNNYIASLSSSLAARLPQLTEAQLCDTVRATCLKTLDDTPKHEDEIVKAVRSGMAKYGRAASPPTAASPPSPPSQATTPTTPPVTPPPTPTPHAPSPPPAEAGEDTVERIPDPSMDVVRKTNADGEVLSAVRERDGQLQLYTRVWSKVSKGYVIEGWTVLCPFPEVVTNERGEVRVIWQGTVYSLDQLRYAPGFPSGATRDHVMRWLEAQKPNRTICETFSLVIIDNRWDLRLPTAPKVGSFLARTVATYAVPTEAPEASTEHWRAFLKFAATDNHRRLAAYLVGAPYYVALFPDRPGPQLLAWGDSMTGKTDFARAAVRQYWGYSPALLSADALASEFRNMHARAATNMLVFVDEAEDTGKDHLRATTGARGRSDQTMTVYDLRAPLYLNRNSDPQDGSSVYAAHGDARRRLELYFTESDKDAISARKDEFMGKDYIHSGGGYCHAAHANGVTPATVRTKFVEAFRSGRSDLEAILEVGAWNAGMEPVTLPSPSRLSPEETFLEYVRAKMIEYATPRTTGRDGEGMGWQFPAVRTAMKVIGNTVWLSNKFVEDYKAAKRREGGVPMFQSISGLVTLAKSTGQTADDIFPHGGHATRLTSDDTKTRTAKLVLPDLGTLSQKPNVPKAHEVNPLGTLDSRTYAKDQISYTRDENNVPNVPKDEFQGIESLGTLLGTLTYPNVPGTGNAGGEGSLAPDPSNPYYFPPGGWEPGEAPTEEAKAEGVAGVTIRGGEVFYDPPQAPAPSKEAQEREERSGGEESPPRPGPTLADRAVGNAQAGGSLAPDQPSYGPFPTTEAALGEDPSVLYPGGVLARRRADPPDNVLFRPPVGVRVVHESPWEVAGKGAVVIYSDGAVVHRSTGNLIGRFRAGGRA